MDIKLTKLAKTPNPLGTIISIDFILMATDGGNGLDAIYQLTPQEVMDVNANDANLMPIIQREAQNLIDDFNKQFSKPLVPILADQATLDSYQILPDSQVLRKAL